MADKVILVGATAGLLYYLYEKYYPEDSSEYDKKKEEELEEEINPLEGLLRFGESIIAGMIFDMLGRRLGSLLERRALARAERAAAKKLIGEAGEKAAKEAAEKGATKAEQAAFREAGEKAMQRELEEKVGLKLAQEAGEKIESKAVTKAATKAGDKASAKAAAKGATKAEQAAVREAAEKASTEAAGKKLATEAGDKAAAKAAAEGASKAEQAAIKEAAEKLAQEELTKKAEKVASQKAAAAASEKAAKEAAEKAGKEALEKATAAGASEAAAKKAEQVAIKQTEKKIAAEALEKAATTAAAEKAAKEAAATAARLGADSAAQEAASLLARKTTEEAAERAAATASAKLAEKAAKEAAEKASTRVAQEAAEKLLAEATAKKIAAEGAEKLASKLAADEAVRLAADVASKAAEKVTSNIAGKVTADMTGKQALGVVRAASQHATESYMARYTLKQAEKAAQRATLKAAGKLSETVVGRMARSAAQAVGKRMAMLGAKLAGVSAGKKAATAAGVKMAVKIGVMGAKASAASSNPFTAILAVITVLSITLMIALDINDEAFEPCDDGDFALSSIPEPLRIILEAIPVVGDFLTLFNPVACLRLRCADGEDSEGLLCYPKPHPDFACHAFLCYADYPEFKPLSSTFAHLTKAIKLDTGLIPMHPPMINGKPGIQSGALFYEDINTETEKWDIVAGVAWGKCPPGYTDRGVFCDDYYFREAGTLRDCPAGWVNDGLICREPLSGGNLELFPCAPGDRDDGLLCWGTEQYDPPPPPTPSEQAKIESDDYVRQYGPDARFWPVTQEAGPPKGGAYSDYTEDRYKCILPISQRLNKEDMEFTRVGRQAPMIEKDRWCKEGETLTTEKDDKGNYQCLKTTMVYDEHSQGMVARKEKAPPFIKHCNEYSTDTYQDTRIYAVGDSVIWNGEPYDLAAFFGGPGYSPQYWSESNPKIASNMDGLSRHDRDVFMLNEATWRRVDPVVEGDTKSNYAPGGWWISSYAKLRLKEDQRVADWEAKIKEWEVTDTWKEYATYEIGSMVEYRGDLSVPLTIEEYYTGKEGKLPKYTCIKVPFKKYKKIEKFLEIGGMKSRTSDYWDYQEDPNGVFQNPELDKECWALTTDPRSEIARHFHDTWVGNTVDGNGVQNGTMYYAKGDIVIFKDKQIYVSLSERNFGLVPGQYPKMWIRMVTVPNDKTDKYEIKLSPVANNPKLDYKPIVLPVTAMLNALNLQIRYTVVQDREFDEELIYKKGHRVIYRGDKWVLRKDPEYIRGGPYAGTNGDGYFIQTVAPDIERIELMTMASTVGQYLKYAPWFPMADDFNCKRLYTVGSTVTFGLTKFKLTRSLSEELGNVLKNNIKADVNNNFCGMAPPLMALYWQKLGWAGKQPRPESESVGKYVNYGN